MQTIAPALLRFSTLPSCARERLELADGDFLDVDHFRQGADRAVVISHGLEGCSKARYVRGLTRELLSAGYDVIAWNMRGCSGELNRHLRSYHSGFTEDLRAVIDAVVKCNRYQTLALAGFSVGGNITLKYLGESPATVSPLITSAVTFSVPTDLTSSAAQLARRENSLYMGIFLRSLFNKLRRKVRRAPGSIDLTGLGEIKTFAQYDARFIAPFFGFASAQDYWTKASSRPFLSRIRVPTLLMSSSDDSFLSRESIPRNEAQFSQYLTLEITRYGGHVGFMRSSPWGRYYSDLRAVEFMEQHR